MIFSRQARKAMLSMHRKIQRRQRAADNYVQAEGLKSRKELTSGVQWMIGARTITGIRGQ